MTWQRGWALLLALVVLLLARSSAAWAQEGEPQTGVNQRLLTGYVHDGQNQPVAGAAVMAWDSGTASPVAQTETQDDGRFSLRFDSDAPLDEPLALTVERPHFSNTTMTLGSDVLAELQSGGAAVMADVQLERRITPAFWVATFIFLLMLVLIALGTMHNTLAALVSATLIFAVSYLGPLIVEDLFIFDFARSLRYVDWNVIFLIMGMMIIIAVVERTGIFQGAAFMA